MTAKVRLLPADEAGDAVLVEKLVRLIDRAYAAGETGLWQEEATRTGPDEIAEAIRGGGMLAATVDDQIVGCAYVRYLDAGTADLGFISAAPEQWGSGVGRELVRSAEELMRSRGVPTMQLELLVPKGWVHPEKDRLPELVHPARLRGNPVSALRGSGGASRAPARRALRVPYLPQVISTGPIARGRPHGPHGPGE